MNLPQLQRDLREVQAALELASARLTHYETTGEQALATDAQRVVEGQQQLLATLTTRIHQLTAHAHT